MIENAKIGSPARWHGGRAKQDSTARPYRVGPVIWEGGGEGSRTPVLEMFSASFYRYSQVLALAPATRTGTIRKTEHAWGSVSLPAARTPAGSQPAVVAPRLSRRQTGNVTVN